VFLGWKLVWTGVYVEAVPEFDAGEVRALGDPGGEACGEPCALA